MARSSTLCSAGAVLLLDAQWMMERAQAGGTLEPRQALLPDAFMSHSAVRAETSGYLHVACISHCWLEARHLDPRGHSLRIVGRALRLLCADPAPQVYFKGRWSVFVDFCSIHQKCQDRDGVPQQHAYHKLENTNLLEDGAIGKVEREVVLFEEALGNLGSFYSHPFTVVFMLSRFPDDY